MHAQCDRMYVERRHVILQCSPVSQFADSALNSVAELTEQMVDDLMAAVDMQMLCAGNLGKTFHKLKFETNLCPSWDKLKEAQFWK